MSNRRRRRWYGPRPGNKPSGDQAQQEASQPQDTTQSGAEGQTQPERRETRPQDNRPRPNNDNRPRPSSDNRPRENRPPQQGGTGENRQNPQQGNRPPQDRNRQPGNNQNRTQQQGGRNQNRPQQQGGGNNDRNRNNRDQQNRNVRPEDRRGGGNDRNRGGGERSGQDRNRGNDNRRQGQDRNRVRDQRNNPPRPRFLSLEEIEKLENETLPQITEASPVCPICNLPIRNVFTAIRQKESKTLCHFECVLTELNKEFTPKLAKGKQIYYVGAGQFALVREVTDKRGNLRTYEILERIPYEVKEN
jgi:hypothetical protein